MKQIRTDNVLAISTGTDEGPVCSGIRVQGSGIKTDPLLLAAVLRHADIADESSGSKRVKDTGLALSALATSLFQYEYDFERGGKPSIFALRKVFESANITVSQTDAYYSAAIAAKVGSSIAILSIGHTRVWKYREMAFESIVEPNVVSSDDLLDSSLLLTSALGLGFESEKIKGVELELDRGEFLLLVMNTNLRIDKDQPFVLDLTQDFLGQLIDKFHTQPMMLAILR